MAGRRTDLLPTALLAGAGVVGGGPHLLVRQVGDEGVADVTQGRHLLRGERVEQALAHCFDVPGRCRLQAGQPASVSSASCPRLSCSHGLRRTQPFSSSRATACEMRLREDSDVEASSLIRSVRPGASDSRTRIS